MSLSVRVRQLTTQQGVQTAVRASLYRGRDETADLLPRGGTWGNKIKVTRVGNIDDFDI